MNFAVNAIGCVVKLLLVVDWVFEVKMSLGYVFLHDGPTRANY